MSPSKKGKKGIKDKNATPAEEQPLSSTSQSFLPPTKTESEREERLAKRKVSTTLLHSLTC